MAGVTIRVSSFYTKKQDKLIAMLTDPEVQIRINKILKDAINQFVPMESGALRNSAEVTPTSIIWGKGLEYAAYQYNGQVYGPNLPIIRQGTIVGWYSRPGVTKHPTGRELGVPGEWKGWVFGYTTPGTKHHWYEQYSKDIRWKARTNIEVTRILKAECKRRGLGRWI